MAEELATMQQSTDGQHGDETERFQTAAQQLADDLVREAERAGDQPEAGLLWCCAGELNEFATKDAEKAFRCYGKAATQKNAPAPAFAGLRRLARKADRHEQLGELYRIEFDAAATPSQRLKAAAQRAIWLSRSGEAKKLSGLDETLKGMDMVEPETALLAYTVREDIALLSKRYTEAAEIQIARLSLLESLTPEPNDDDKRELAELAASIAMTHRYLTGDKDAAAAWFERSFCWMPTETALHSLGSLGWREKFPSEYAEFATQLIASSDHNYVQARESFELGMLQAYKLGDREAAANAFRDGMKLSELGVASAIQYIGMRRGESEASRNDELVDALGMRAEHAASAGERSDCLYQMALIFDGQMGLPDAAIELLRDSLSISPEYQPAARALSRLYQRRGAWNLLAELLESEVSRTEDNWRTRMRLAQVYQDRLLAPERAEPHLRVVLSDAYYQPAAHRLGELLGKQQRFDELHELLLFSAESETDVRERLYHLERAADVAETRLSKPEVAVECWRSVHEIDPLHPGCLAALGRLLRQLNRWEDLVNLNRDEIAVRDEPDAAARLWTDTGEIYSQRLNDEANAQQCFEFALEVFPTYEPALEGLGRILWSHQDWDGLIDMNRAEIASLPTGQRRTRRMLDLAELQAVQANRPEAALATYQTVFRDDPQNEEALLWMERLQQVLQDDARVLAVLERRLKQVEPEGAAFLGLRAGALAEWALSNPKRAWSHYLLGLRSPLSLPHAVRGLSRVWPHIVEDEELVAEGVAALRASAEGEERSSLIAEMTGLASIVEKGNRSLADWAEMAGGAPLNIVAHASAEVAAASSAHIDKLIGLRRDRRAGSVWALAAALDEADGGSDLNLGLLPDNTLVTELLAEMDRIPGAPMSENLSVEFRQLLREWESGDQTPVPSGEHPSIPALRLSSRAALEAGNELQASRFVEQEAKAWSATSTVQRRFVEAAELRHSCDRDAARILFEEALGLGCFDDDSRSVLYESLARLSELDLLAEGLTAHVAHCAVPEARLPWLKRLAAVCEQAADRNGALSALQSILTVNPSDCVALLEQSRLLTLEGLEDEARVTLERALRRQFPNDERIQLLSRLADLQLMDGGDGSKAVAALEEASELAGATPNWLRRLARVHYAYGKPDRAIGLLVEALPSSIVIEDLQDWFLLAKLKYLKLDDPDGARELLWGLMEKFPGSLDVLAELESFYRKNGGASELADRISRLLLDPPEQLESTVKAFLWEYVGDLNYQVLRRNRDAEVAFEAALSAGGEPCQLNLKAARAVAQQPGKSRSAYERFSSALAHPDVGLPEWQEVVDDLEALFEGIEDQARVRVIRQIGELLNQQKKSTTGSSRVKRDPGREVDLELAVQQLCSGLLGEGSLEVINALRPILERCFGDRRPRRRVIGGKRFKPNDAPDFFKVLELAAETLGSSVPRLFTAAGRLHPEWVSNGFLVPGELIESMDELSLRFWAGHTIGSTAPGLSALSLAQPGELESILAEIARLAAGGASADSGLLKEVASSKHSAARATIVELLERYPEVIDRVTGENWFSVPVFVADRFGLLLTGDVSVAAEAVVAINEDLKQLKTPERIVSEQRPRTLLEYALSAAYQELRYHAGLGARPRVL